MKRKLYPRLALLGIKKNARLYIPYLICCTVSTAMYYIIDFLSRSSVVKGLKGGSNVSVFLSMGKCVIAFFVALFIFYTNTFLSRRRNKEFGLYNILGMDKRGIMRVIVWESFFVCTVSLLGGLTFGIALSKAAELALLYVVKAQVDYRFTVLASSVGYTVGIFLIIFSVILLNTLTRVRLSGALELMNSEKAGEKPPKVNKALAVIGFVILVGAYAISLLSKTPLSTVSLFLVAVIMVIIATYILFMTGSVALCKALQRNKKYYYQKNHFISVSSMTFRMKRNGAGLASICILSTMVLVMIASSSSLYFGADNSIRARFPYESIIEIEPEGIRYLSDRYAEKLKKHYAAVLGKNGAAVERDEFYRYAQISGIFSGKQLDPDASVISSLVNADEVRNVCFLSQTDYNRLMGTAIRLSDGEAMLATIRCRYDRDELCIGNVTFRITGKLAKCPENGMINVSAVPAVMVVIRDFSALQPLDTLADYNGDRMLKTGYSYSYDLNGNEELTLQVIDSQRKAFNKTDTFLGSRSSFSRTISCLPEERSDFYVTYGGLFFIGILLSLLFIFFMAIILYYKQISEGYEDKARFAIMKKVGMSGSDILKSINSQTLTVFFAPLIMAGVHLCFAFPPIWKLLTLFNLTNLSFVIAVTAGAYVLFGIFYIVLYKITSAAYARIVNGETYD